MNEFKKGSQISVPEEKITSISGLFSSLSIDDNATCDVIKKMHLECGEVVDPHTATAIEAARICGKGDAPMVILATAHPAKFDEAIKRAGLASAELPTHMQGLFSREEKFDVIDNNINDVKDYISGLSS